MQTCRLCGQAVRAGARFCPRCGTDTQARVCTGCAQPNPANAQSCQYCGKFLVLVCPQCKRENKLLARFCAVCGAGLGVCPHCGAQNRPGARFCRQCGQDPTNVHQQPLVRRLIHQRYQIQELIARGGMGAVYEVTDVRQAGSTWALKEIVLDSANLAEQQEAIESFRQEAQILATLDHPNLPKFIDYFSDGGKEYLVMERVQGENLDTLRNNAPLGESDVLRIAFQLCAVLNYLHQRKPPIIYRDLKPGNIMMEPASGFLKLIDFGIARFHKPGKKQDTITLGTPGFAPPEQYGNGQTDARSDIFALGVTLHILLTNFDVEQNPWNYPPASTLNPAVSIRLDQVIAKATELDMGARYQSIDEMRAALLQCKGARSIARQLPKATPPAPPPRFAAPPSTNQPAWPSARQASGTPGAMPGATAISVDKPALTLRAQKNSAVQEQLQIKSLNGAHVDIDLTTSVTWLEVTPKKLTSPDAEIEVKAHTTRFELPRVHRPAPNLLAKSWKWAEQRGAQRKPWQQTGTWRATLLAGVPALLLGGIVYGLLWTIYLHADYLVPGASNEQGAIEIRHPGGTQTIPVTLAVDPTKLHVILGWIASTAAVAGELTLLLWLL